MGHEALTAVALHADQSADRAMESFVRPAERRSLRKQAAFWWAKRAAKPLAARNKWRRAIRAPKSGPGDVCALREPRTGRHAK